MRTHALLLVMLLLAPLLSACSRPLELPADTAAMGQSGPLRAFAAALGAPAAPAESLFTGEVRFRTRPDPSEWLEATRVSNPPARPDAVPLKVLTWNVGLLDAILAGTRLAGERVPLLEAPLLDARRAVLPAALAGSGADLILLEEVWQLTDEDAIARAAAGAGYETVDGWHPMHEMNPTGLLILYRRDVFTEVPMTRRHEFFRDSGFDLVPVPSGVFRGYLTVTLEHPTLGRVHVYAAHTTPFPDQWRRRGYQVRELGLEVASHPADELVLVGGDMNGGVAYRDDVWPAPGGPLREVFANATTWALALHYGEMVDLFARANGALDVAVAFGAEVEPAALRQRPGGLPEWCTAERLRVFTGTDCNGLYFQQYAGEEPAARLDHLWARDLEGRVHVARVEPRFREPVALGEHTAELSDHYALETELLVAPR